MMDIPIWVWWVAAAALVVWRPRLLWAIVRLVFGLMGALMLVIFAGACL